MRLFLSELRLRTVHTICNSQALVHPKPFFGLYATCTSQFQSYKPSTKSLGMAQVQSNMILCFLFTGSKTKQKLQSVKNLSQKLVATYTSPLP
jgi:hypothetical protein